MGILEVVIFILWILCVIVQLTRSDSFARFALGSICDAVVLGILYVILHFAIKYW